jgi:hypothetical protein
VVKAPPSGGWVQGRDASRLYIQPGAGLKIQNSKFKIQD